MVGLEPLEQNIKTEIDFYDDHHETVKETKKKSDWRPGTYDS